MTHTVDREAHLDALRSTLADFGVTLFERSRGERSIPGPDAYAALLVDLLRSGDPRLRLAVPCILAAHDGELASAATSRAAALLDAVLTPPRDGA